MEIGKIGVIKRIDCSVIQYGAGDDLDSITIYFKNKSLYLYTNEDLSNFAVDCGMIEPPENWNRKCETLDYDWWNIDWDSITKCPEKYEKRAE